MTLAVAKPVVVEEYVVIAKGAPAKGVLLETKRPRVFGGRGFLKIRIDEVELADGQMLPLHGVAAAKGAGRGQEATNAWQALNRLNPYLGLVVYIAMPGQDVGIQAGKPVYGFTAQDVILDPSKLRASIDDTESDTEKALSAGHELTFNVIHLRAMKHGNAGVLRVGATGARFISDTEDEHVTFTSTSIKSVYEEPSLVPCGISGLGITPRKGKRYAFDVFDASGQLVPPYQAIQALEWLMKKKDPSRLTPPDGGQNLSVNVQDPRH